MPDELKPEKYLEPVKQWMREHEKWLFIFDNADNLKNKRKWIPEELPGMRHVLFTSREEDWDEVADVLPVELFSLEEAREYFVKATGRNDDGSLDDLIDELGYLPLAMAQAAAFIRKGWKNHSKKGYKDYLKLFTERTEEMLRRYPTAEAAAEKRAVYVTWNISMERIKNTKENAWHLLNIMAFFAPDGIQQEWFVQGQEALPDSLQKEIGDELKWMDIRDALTGHSLVEESEGGALGMHRLVGEVIRDKLRATEEFEIYAGYAVGVGEKLYFDKFSTRESRNAFEAVYPHIESVVENCALQNQDARVAVLCSFLGRGVREVWGSYDLALEWHEKALSIREKALGKEHTDTGATYNSIAFVYCSKGEYDLALEWYEKALVIAEKVSGKEHPNTAVTYNNIANVYDDKGEYDLALEWHEKALAIREKVLGKEHPETAATYNNIAIIYRNKGEYDRALEWHEKALAIREKVLGKEHLSTATTSNNIACVYDSKGEYDRALEWYEKALAIREKILGKEHPDTATTYNNIAGVYDSKGEYDRALEWYEKALAIREKILGKEHQDTATTYGNIASVYALKGKHDLALEWYEKALAIREKVLGKEHPATATTYNNIALVYENKGEYDRALALFEKALAIWKEKPGEKHLNTILVRDNIAECKHKMQR